MNLLILGASGLVGWNLWQAAKAAGHRVTGTFNNFPIPGLVRLRMDDPRELETLLRDESADAVVCCTAWSWVDGCESDRARAFRENAEQPARAAEIAHSTRTMFVHFSTSYVFDGNSGPYDEDAAPRPISVYAESKLAGELDVAEATDGKAMIVRTMGVYGTEPQGKNFVYQVRRNLSAGNRMQVPVDQWGNATEAGDMAGACLGLLARGATGIWNIAGPDPNLNRVAFARQIAEAYSLDAELIDAVPTSALGQPARRPRQAGLRTEKVERFLGWKPAGWRKPAGLG